LAKQEAEMLKKMERDKHIHDAMELKQKQINDVKSKLDNMNEQVDKVLKQKEDMIKEKKMQEDLMRQ
jgi:hypothetical protein